MAGFTGLDCSGFLWLQESMNDEQDVTNSVGMNDKNDMSLMLASSRAPWESWKKRAMSSVSQLLRGIAKHRQGGSHLIKA